MAGAGSAGPTAFRADSDTGREMRFPARHTREPTPEFVLDARCPVPGLRECRRDRDLDRPRIRPE